MNSSTYLCIFFVPVVLFSRCNATIDLSNVDFLNFKYFKNLPDHGLSKDSLLQPITSKVQKAKAVVDYFKNVLFGNPTHENVRIIEFDPHFGDAWHPHFEHHYGHKGEHLIEALGKGLNHAYDHHEHIPEIYDHGHYHHEHVQEIHDHGHYHEHTPEVWDHHH